jgi:peptide/nickel transport system ATP-binding protein
MTRSAGHPFVAHPGTLRAVAPPLFELSDVHASRGGAPVLRGVDVTLRDGATALLGPSGAGKSTLLRLLNRLADPDRGAIRFRGEDVRSQDPRALRRRACLVPQLPALLPGTVADNIRFGPALVGRAVGAARPLELAGLSAAFADREASRLSVGEQQRVMLARALALEPETLLLDEPTSALDVSVQAEILNLLRRLHRERHLTMILVSHNMAVVGFLCQRVAVMRDGEIVEQLPIEAVREQNVAHEYTRSLLLATEGYRRNPIDPA